MNLEEKLKDSNIEDIMSKKEYVDNIVEKPKEFKKVDNLEWKELRLVNLDSQGLFYEDGYKVFIKSVSLEDIVHFSNMEEDDFDDKAERMEILFQKCVRVVLNEKILSFEEICDIDKLMIFFSIRDYTFANYPNEIYGMCNCTECNLENKININSVNTFFFEANEEFIKSYNPSFKTIHYDLKDGSTLDFTFPKIGVLKAIEKYRKNKIKSGLKVNNNFLKFLSFTEKNNKLDDTTIHNKITEMLSWSLLKISLLVKLIGMYEKGIVNISKFDCVHCGAKEVSSKFRFPKEYIFKHFFLIQNPFEHIV